VKGTVSDAADERAIPNAPATRKCRVTDDALRPDAPLAFDNTVQHNASWRPVHLSSRSAHGYVIVPSKGDLSRSSRMMRVPVVSMETYGRRNERAGVMDNAESGWRAVQELEEVRRSPQVDIFRTRCGNAGAQTGWLIGAQTLPCRLSQAEHRYEGKVAEHNYGRV
jgi:hypothetical protein